ncbi:MAG: enoyl-CoA hydratase/isomerase family protein, partial [Planctomycetes bacterium]|nr:enoyl-CoA hydratase/isomerase family protein [Planctomycetota bacterium]
MNFTRILVDEKDGLATITLNRPEQRNAIDREMIDELHHALDALAEADAIGALVLTGAGGQAFAAGADIAQLRERKRADALKAINSTLFMKLEQFPFPTIAAIQGFALGGGCELAMACDLRIAGRSSKFGQPEVGLGILAGAGAIERLPRLVGLGRAKELLYTARVIDAEEALRIGLVNQVVDDGKALEAATTLAQSIAKNDRLAVRLTKASLNASARSNDQVGIAIDAIAQAVCFESEEKVRRMTAFLERKKKEGSGRMARRPLGCGPSAGIRRLCLRRPCRGRTPRAPSNGAGEL